MKPVIHEQDGVRVAVAVQVIHARPTTAVAGQAVSGIASGAGAAVCLAARLTAGVVACAFWVVCRAAQVVLLAEHALGGSHRQLSRVAYWLPRDTEHTGMELYRD